MIKMILVPATGDERDAAVFAAALAVARAFDAHIEFLHIRVDAVALAATMTAEGGSGMMVSGLIDRIESDSDQREAAAKAGFDGFRGREGLALADSSSGPKALSASWRREIGVEPDWLVTYGRVADLIVFGRSGEGNGASSGSLEAALIDSGRPIFLPPAAPLAALPDKVAIAWKETREAARAVTAALPFLARAKEILVLVVEEEGAAAEPADRLAAALAWRGCPVSVRRLAPAAEGAGEALLGEAKKAGAMLVMGGYGHSRLREWVFGGVTRRVSQSAEIPVLIAH
ncbi:MAG TPA: universal stress protein [Stellaceae bacterium]|nr:universal stress protein [Stellaceae bacterium]